LYTKRASTTPTTPSQPRSLPSTYFRHGHIKNRKKRCRASLNVKRDRNGRETRYLVQEIAKKMAVNDAQLRLRPNRK